MYRMFSIIALIAFVGCSDAPKSAGGRMRVAPGEPAPTVQVTKTTETTTQAPLTQAPMAIPAEPTPKIEVAAPAPKPHVLERTTEKTVEKVREVAPKSSHPSPKTDSPAPGAGTMEWDPTARELAALDGSTRGDVLFAFDLR